VLGRRWTAMKNLWLLSILTAMQQSEVLGQKATFLDSYMGCFKDDPKHRDLQWYGGNGKTVDQCRKLAQGKGFPFFGVQNGGECWAGWTHGRYGPHGADSYCAEKGYKNKKETSSERMLFYGGGRKNAIYSTEEQWFKMQDKKSMFRKGLFVGCYHDNGDREYDDEFKDKKGKKVTWTSVESVEECGNLAVTNKMPFFAMQVGHECRMSKNMFNTYQVYPPTLGNSACAKYKGKKASKKWGDYGGSNWVNAIYYTESSPYYPGAYWEAPAGDGTIRLAWANAYCLNIQFAKYVSGAQIMAYPCVDVAAKTSDNMKFVVEDGLIKSKKDPKMCISYKGKKLETSKTLTLEKCGEKETFQKIQLFDDMTIRFTDQQEFGFNVFGGIGDENKITNRLLKTYKVTAANNEAFLIRSPVLPTPKPTPVPTPAPPLTGLSKAKGWSITKGKCTIDITSGVPCAVTPNYPKHYSDDQSCTVKMTNTKAVNVETFITEKYFDEVQIGDVKMSGQLGKIYSIPLKKGVDVIEWTSDFYLAAKGWKICKGAKKKPPMPIKKKKEKKPVPKCNEKLAGKKGADYRGCQTKTKSGKTCQKWSSQSPHKHSRTPASKKYGKFKLVKNYCRNPDGEPGIWCYTTDKKKRWEFCNPVGEFKQR